MADTPPAPEAITVTVIAIPMDRRLINRKSTSPKLFKSPGTAQHAVPV
jgi:hypothetical protein